MTWTLKEKPNVPFLEGYYAAGEGARLHENPHRIAGQTDYLAREWIRGWSKYKEYQLIGPPRVWKIGPFLIGLSRDQVALPLDIDDPIEPVPA